MNLNLIEWLDAMPSKQDIAWQMKKAQAIHDWCLRDLGFAVGDRVRIKDDLKIAQDSGWDSYRECLAVGALGEVRKIDFNQFSKVGIGAWHADIRLDREWSVSGYPVPHGTRYWHGPVADTPAGYKKPSKYDQEHYPLGDRHLFAILVENLEREPVEITECVVCGGKGKTDV